MLTPAERAIVQCGRLPTIIVTEDTVTRYDSVDLQDCSHCQVWRGAHHVAIAPSLDTSGYRVVGLCRHCAAYLVNSGNAVDRRPAEDNAVPPAYRRFLRAMGQEA